MIATRVVFARGDMT